MADRETPVWSYTEGMLIDWMNNMHQSHTEEGFYSFPNPDSLTEEQNGELRRRIAAMIDNSDGPVPGIHNFLWHILTDMGLIDRTPR